jgi:hypothetical protein
MLLFRIDMGNHHRKNVKLPKACCPPPVALLAHAQECFWLVGTCLVDLVTRVVTGCVTIGEPQSRKTY